MADTPDPTKPRALFASVDIPPGVIHKVPWEPHRLSATAFPAPEAGPDGQPVEWVKGSGWFPDEKGQLLHWSYRRPKGVGE